MNLSEGGDELIKTTLRVANGRLTCAEALGHREFVMTKLYSSALNLFNWEFYFFLFRFFVS